MNGLKALFALVGWAAGLAAPVALLAVLPDGAWLAVDSFASLLAASLLAAAGWALCDIAGNVRRLAAEDQDAPDRPETPNAEGGTASAERHQKKVEDAAERALENLRRNRRNSQRRPT